MKSSFFSTVVAIECLGSVLPIGTCCGQGQVSCTIFQCHSWTLCNIYTYIHAQYYFHSCVKNNDLILKHFEILGQMFHIEWKAEYEQGRGEGCTVLGWGKGWSVSSLITSNQERREHYSNPRWRQLAPRRNVNQNFSISLDFRVYPLQGILSIQESALAPTLLYTHNVSAFHSWGLCLWSKTMYCVTGWAHGQRRSLYANCSACVILKSGFCRLWVRKREICKFQSWCSCSLKS